MFVLQPSAEVQVLTDKNWTKDEDLESARANVYNQVSALHFSSVANSSQLTRPNTVDMEGNAEVTIPKKLPHYTLSRDYLSPNLTELA